jgi:dynein heavy chain
MEGLCYAFSEDTNVKSKEKGPPSNSDFWDYAKKSMLNEKLIKRVKDFKID